jgi:hypothetical protein
VSGFRFKFWIPAAILLALTTAGSEAHDLEVGKPFPDLVLPSLNGGAPASVADFRGQKLVLHLWASW